MRIVIFGTGGVGGYFGGRLVQDGHDVTFIARGAHLNALQNQGIRITSPEGDFAGPVDATDDPGSVTSPDLVLMATKAWQIREAAASIKSAVTADTLVVPLQNGVEAAAELVDVIGAKSVMGGLCRILSHIAGPGHIVHVGADPTIVFGELERGKSTRGELVQRVLDSPPGMHAEMVDDIHLALWQKFLLMAPISGLSSVTRAPMGTIRSLPETRTLLESAMKEVVNLARASGVDVAPTAVDKTLSFIDTLPFESIPSMHRDIAEGRPSELESQTGAVVRLGHARGVDVPVNRFLYHALLPLELRARGKIDFKS